MKTRILSRAPKRYAPLTGRTRKRLLVFLITGLIPSTAAIAQTQQGASQTGDSTINNTAAIPLLYNLKSPANLNISSAQSVQGDKLMGMPGNNFKSTLAGRIPGLFVGQTDGRPGLDAYSLSLRGQNPLIVIDGVPQDITFVDYTEIETVTVLKDALATAMYGPRGSNGVVLITTKKGKPGKSKVSVTAQSGIQQSLRPLKGLNAYDYATLYNEALANDHLAPVYTQADLDAYKNHTDPLGHPDVNWQDQAFKNASRLDRLTINLSGGSNIARYFVVGEYLNSTGIFNTQKDLNTYSTNSDFQSYMVRSNVDINLNSATTVGLNILGRILEGNEPGTTASTVISNAYTTPNNAIPVFNADGSLGGNQQFQNNIYGQLNSSGYRRDYERNVLADVYLKRNFDNIIKGLWAKAMVSFSGALSQNIVRNKTFATYLMNVGSASDTSYTKYSADGTQNNTASTDNQWRQSYTEFDLGFTRNFGKHGIDAVVLYSSNSTRVNSDLPLTYKGLSGRVAYNYDERYMAEVTFGYNGANRYPEGFRYRLFPAAGLGWNIHKEAFMKNVTWLNRLKLYGSYGKTGNNRNGYYSYKQYFFDGDKVFFGTTPSSFTTMDELILANPFLDYEKANKLNIGLEGAVLKDQLSFSVEVYRNNYYDVLKTRGKSSTIIGNSYPVENIGRSRYSGVDASLTWSSKVADLSYYITGNVSVIKTKYLDIDEVYQPYDWMKRTGKPVNQAFGYQAIGLFKTPQDLQMAPGVALLDGYTPQLGDVMYKDLNGDGIINQFDESPIGNTKPLVYFGTTIGASWKGIDFSALVQGAFNRDIALTGTTEWEFQNGGFGNAYQQHLDRWTPDNPNATYPRLTVGSNPNNHIASSSLWYHNGNYARLKFVELGYTFSSGWIKKAHLEAFRLFANATNLFTLSAYDRVDPEAYGSAFPMQRTISAGLTIKL